MISKRSQALFLLPLYFGKFILCTPGIWNARKQRLLQSTGLVKFNYFNYGVGCAMGQFMVGLLHVEAILSGYATKMEIIECFFLLPLYGMVIAVGLNVVVYWKPSVYLVNQILELNKEMCQYFGLNRYEPDGAEKTIIFAHWLAIIVGFGSVPSTAFLLHTNPGFFYNIRFDTLEMNMLLSTGALFAFLGDLLHINFWAVAVYLHMRSCIHYLKLMAWTKFTTNEELREYIRFYRQIQMVNVLFFENFGKNLFPVALVSVGIMMIIFLFNIIHLNLSISPFFGIQMCTCLTLCAFAFKLISENVYEFTAATETFLESYSKFNMQDMSVANQYELKACRPIKIVVKPLLTFQKLTFVTAMQNVILARTIDLLLGVKQ